MVIYIYHLQLVHVGDRPLTPNNLQRALGALGAAQEMRRFCWLSGAAAKVPKMANMVSRGVESRVSYYSFLG